MTAYYNEIDPEAVTVLKELVTSGVIAPGDVDNRSIKEVTADDVRGYTQCHFFAGAGLWSVGARLAGWPDDRPLWSASCPCQPFSAAGKQLGADDPRHLWPDLYRILSAARASGQHIPTLVGEQVAGSVGYNWFDGVRTDLAREEIAARTVDIPACAVDAPHERNRLWWVAVANTKEQRGWTRLREGGAIGHGLVPTDGDGGDNILANAKGIGRGREFTERRSEGRTADGFADAAGAVVNTAGERWGQGSAEPEVLRRRTTPARTDVCEHIDVADASGIGRQVSSSGQLATISGAVGNAYPHRNGSWWADGEWITCHDGKARRAKPSIPMLVDGMAGRSSVWRLAGNSIVPQLAAEVIASILDVEALAGASTSLPRNHAGGAE